MANERQSLKGTHQARVVEAKFKETEGDDPKLYLGIMFEITKGPAVGRMKERRLFFTDGALERTLESMRHCGWRGETLDDLSGLGDNEVSLVIGEKLHNGKTYDEINWINKLPKLNGKDITPEKLRAFSDRMERLTKDSARNYGVQPAARAASTAFGNGAAPASGADDYDAPPDEAYS